MIKPINIKIKDNWRYGVVAFLVDRGDFLDDLKQTREGIGLKKLITYSKFVNEDKKRALETGERKLDEEAKRWLSYSLNVDRLRRKYHKPDNFGNVIRYALLTGTVMDRELPSSSFLYTYKPNDRPDYDESKMEDDLLDALLRRPDPPAFIVLTPQTKKKEIKKAFKEYEDYLKEYKIKNPDTRDYVKRDRKWYWLHKKGMSYTDIHEKAMKEHIFIGLEGIKMAIRRYKRCLFSKFTPYSGVKTTDV